MILELVRFRHPPGKSREDLLEGARAALPRWQADEALVRKYFAASLDHGQGLGVYLWPTLADARAGHDAAWIAQAQARTGGPVEITYHDLLLVLDREHGTTGEPPPSPDLPTVS